MESKPQSAYRLVSNRRKEQEEEEACYIQQYVPQASLSL